MDFMEIFTLVTGVIYIVLEIRQKNFMWVVGIATSLAAMWVFFRQGLYASLGLNTYYLVTSFVGLWQWGRDRQKLKAERNRKKDAPTIHLNRLGRTTVIVSALVVAAGTWGLAQIMELLENPMSYLDSGVAVLSAVATWWLVRSYIQQWWLWIVADTMSTILCATQGMWWMTALYAAYTLSAIYGYIHWKRHGHVI
ncbi:MAG: nicotinamide mononucleotide transporter [Bacteroidales bacterium]|nr:nicotinamide mononucleotide transporter [Bacteroidales bacterium]MBR2857487.1 nicotinamide mononucleotide transporter [Bacteroidales bacterium]